jgi:hypothetical protein
MTTLTRGPCKIIVEIPRDAKAFVQIKVAMQKIEDRT